MIKLDCFLLLFCGYMVMRLCGYGVSWQLLAIKMMADYWKKMMADYWEKWQLLAIKMC